MRDIIVVAGEGGGPYHGTGGPLCWWSTTLAVVVVVHVVHGRLVVIVVMLAWTHYRLHRLCCAGMDILLSSQVVVVHRWHTLMADEATAKIAEQ